MNATKSKTSTYQVIHPATGKTLGELDLTVEQFCRYINGAEPEGFIRLGQLPGGFALCDTLRIDSGTIVWLDGVPSPGSTLQCESDHYWSADTGDTCPICGDRSV